jgi:hypothetical protein
MFKFLDSNFISKPFRVDFRETAGGYTKDVHELRTYEETYDIPRCYLATDLVDLENYLERGSAIIRKWVRKDNSIFGYEVLVKLNREDK